MNRYITSTLSNYFHSKVRESKRKFLICPRCKTLVDKHSTVCPKCGNKL